MRLPSRFIPPRVSPRLGWSGAFLLVSILIGFVCFIYSLSKVGRYVAAAVVCSVLAYSWFQNKRTKRRFELLAASRNGDSICEFASSFDTRSTDTWIIRAAHQELQAILQSYLRYFPVRASDSLLVDLALDVDDVEDLLRDIAKRSRRSLAKTEENPYFGRLNTVKDLVLFINAQPKTTL
ncbi:hypothetical protein [Duganella fentianensis]|uniref:hypothetical protein n=1 Tax=Duganella fentianensis TaxID=2692177 RepID=UPI0032B2F633